MLYSITKPFPLKNALIPSFFIIYFAQSIAPLYLIGSIDLIIILPYIVFSGYDNTPAVIVTIQPSKKLKKILVLPLERRLNESYNPKYRPL